MALYERKSVQSSTQPKGSRSFFSAHPVFRRDEYARAVGRKSTDRVVSAMLRQHLKAGNIRRVARGVFAAVPAHGDAATWPTDRFLAASRLKPDAVIAYHSALELHGAAYTDAPDVQAVSAGEPTVFATDQFACRFVKRPAGFVAKHDVTTVDRGGLTVRVTTLERTLADLFDRLDLAGGADELFNSLALVERVKADDLVRAVRGLKDGGAAGAVGWWLEREQDRLGVPASALKSLHTLQPKHPQYVLGAQRGEAKFVKDWNILVPKALAAPTFEGV
jgi:predicted transcriptional regulator of viral defense system